VSEQEALGLVSDQVQRRHKLVPIELPSRRVIASLYGTHK
jgi:hypothetical protein